MAGARVIAILLALAMASGPAVSGVTYTDVPPEIVRVSVHGWQDAALPVRIGGDVDRQEGKLTIRAAPDRRVIVRLERADGAYLLDGPFWWPARDAQRALDRRWRRTLAVASSGPIAGAAEFEWLSAHGEPATEWPRCFQTGDRLWTCWGATTGDAGVLFCRAGTRVWWTAVARGAAPSLRSSTWGRLLIVPDVPNDPAGVRVTFAHPVLPSSLRIPGVRLETAVVPRTQATPVAPGVLWLAGDEVPARAWVEIRATQAGPVYVPLQDVADGSPSLPLTVHLNETLVVYGVAVGAREERGNSALITLFRLIDPLPSSSTRSREKPRRVLAAETIADRDGAFHLDGIGDADYEVVAWHPQLGRASILVPRTPGRLVIRLESPGTVRGRVVMAGKPLASADVISLPSPEAFSGADDLVDLKGGDTRTGEDGRFAVMLAAGGGGELRVGGGTLPIRRIPLPRAPVPLLDLGDIDLGSPLELAIVLDQDSACDLRATGPIGQSGLQIITGARTGPGLFRIVLPEAGLWAFELLCGKEERPLAQPTIQVTPASAGKEFRFAVR
jgi:hypothetical protein